ncbi:hypothetical protein C8R43DRAFT_1086263 [Mycena crocata]|nr:hypothetical protein C8R43DRAFT_1086263 [Mycena crocata]
MSSQPWTPLGKHAFIQRPNSAIESSPNDPTVVLLFGWMAAKRSHLHKYTAMYRQIYPNATIVLIRSHLSYFCTSASGLDARFKPVIEALDALECFSNQQRILTHSFSNGGSFHILALAPMLRSKVVDTQTPPAPSAWIIDSSPGGDAISKVQLALTSPIKNVLLKVLAKFLARLVLTFLAVLNLILRRPSPIQVMMRGIRNPSVLPWINSRSPRLYIYSKADEMVPWVDIEAHAATSAADGLDVRRLRFDDSPHVAHARTHPEKYWTAVKGLWSDACSTEK